MTRHVQGDPGESHISRNSKMIFTFSRLGRMGRFGNQLFEIAATIGFATANGASFEFPPWEFSPLFKHHIPQVPIRRQPDITLYQHAFHYLPLSISTAETCIVDLAGYFQSEKYFSHCAETIRYYFEPAAQIRRALELGYGEILRSRQTCIIVVRRGDYVTDAERHPPQTAEFYAAAMAIFDPDTVFFITSDDNAWCHEHITGKNVVVLPQPAWMHNFFLGMLCQHAIISNSTFGWWFAYLNQHPEKHVIAAKNWFGPGLAHNNVRDLIPKGWIII